MLYKSSQRMKNKCLFLLFKLTLNSVLTRIKSWWFNSSKKKSFHMRNTKICSMVNQNCFYTKFSYYSRERLLFTRKRSGQKQTTFTSSTCYIQNTFIMKLNLTQLSLQPHSIFRLNLPTNKDLSEVNWCLVCLLLLKYFLPSLQRYFTHYLTQLYFLYFCSYGFHYK